MLWFVIWELRDKEIEREIETDKHSIKFRVESRESQTSQVPSIEIVSAIVVYFRCILTLKSLQNWRRIQHRQNGRQRKSNWCKWMRCILCIFLFWFVCLVFQSSYMYVLIAYTNSLCIITYCNDDTAEFAVHRECWEQLRCGILICM